MNFKKAFLTFLSVVVSVTPCYSNAMKESSYCESSPLINKSKKIENCPICLEKMDPNKDGLTSSGCGANVSHIYHARCWNEWIEKAPRDDNDKIACPMCKKPCDTSIYCSYCYALINDDEAVSTLGCGHRVHSSCINEVEGYITDYPLSEICDYTTYCVICDRLTNSMCGSLGNTVRHLSQERIKKIIPMIHRQNLAHEKTRKMLQGYPDLYDTLCSQCSQLEKQLKPKNTCNKKLLVLLGLGAVASVIGAYAVS